MSCMQRKLLFLITVIIEYLESLCILLNKILVGLTYQLFRSIRSRHSGFSIDAFLHQIPFQGIPPIYPGLGAIIQNYNVLCIPSGKPGFGVSIAQYVN